ncbi:hypothetical protein ACFXHA_21840 [Nocardia sp. NPDC059240]|uniref:hypothetical protein n=1 Tax=Nocardia sp. NPDC059240 TaxID=3346786 RepID=UPI0036B7AF68
MASTELVSVAESIVQGIVDADVRWDSVAVVVNLDRQKSMFGYIYTDDGQWNADVPLEMEVLTRAINLRTAMAAPKKKDWKVCCIQIRRSDMSVDVEFEYKNSGRWQITPVNLESKIEELRPR